MKKFAFGLIAAISAGLFAWVIYLVLSSPPEPTFGAANHNAVIARLDHIFRVAAYSVTWAIQLGYVGWLGLKWQSQKENTAAAGRNSR